MDKKIKYLSTILFDYFVINQRYYAIQRLGDYEAKKQFINSVTIERMLNTKDSFLCYQEDFNKIKWICFDFDINKEVRNQENFDEIESSLYIELINEISKLTTLLYEKKINYLVEYSGNRGIHIWILFDNKLTRQEGAIIFEKILLESNLFLDIKKFSLDKYPKSRNSSNKTDKGTGVKIPLSFHKKSKKYSILLPTLENFDLQKIARDFFDEEFIDSQIKILIEYKKNKKEDLFNNLSINIDIEIKKEELLFINSSSTTSNVKELNNIVSSLSKCKHLKDIFEKSIPNEKERRIIVGCLGQLRDEDDKDLGQKLLKLYFNSLDGAIETIIDERLRFANKFLPPSCKYFQKEYGQNCKCELVSISPLEHLENFSFHAINQFEINRSLLQIILLSEKKYMRQNDEINLFHTQNLLDKLDYTTIRNEIEKVYNNDYFISKFYKFERIEKKQNDIKIRNLYALQAKDKVITTFLIKVLDSLLYKSFSSRSYGYKFNPSFRKNNIFEEWLKQWNIYIKELETLIYSHDFKDYHILKLDIKSFYDAISIEKLNIDLTNEVGLYKNNNIIDELDEKKYLAIINTLIRSVEHNTAKEGFGLPQGPAFARYLAEFYLSSLDKKIESLIDTKNGFFYRYVDDMFIIMPDKDDILKIKDEIIKHLATKDLKLNTDKSFEGTIHEYKLLFKDYVDNTKYFIDQVQKHQEVFTQTTIHKATTKLIGLIDNNNDEINDSNLSFFFTHLSDEPRVVNKRKELEDYVIGKSINRGSFYRVFWHYYFSNNTDLSHSDDLKQLTGLKRESFLNSLIAFLYKNDSLNINILKEILDKYLETELTEIEKLSLFEVYLIKNCLYNEKIVNLVNDDLNIYNDLLMSKNSKEIPEQLIKKINSLIIATTDNDKKFEYIFNIIMYSRNNQIKLYEVLSSIFINTTNTLIDTKGTIDYLEKTNTIYKFLQILYISILYSKIEDNEFSLKIKNILDNIDNSITINSEELNLWKKVVQKIGLDYSNINKILPMISQFENNKKYAKVINQYFDKLVELIFLDSNDTMQSKEPIEKIKKYLIEEKDVKYLEWLNERHYPNSDICIQNALHNDIIVLQNINSNKILVRIKSECVFNNSIPYLTIEEEKSEKLFDGKYKTIIFSFILDEFDKPLINPSIKNMFDYINMIVNINKGVKKFQEYQSCDSYINFFYDEYYYKIDTFEPLIPFDAFGNNFINSIGFDYKNERNYYSYIIRQIERSSKKFFQSEIESNIFEINNKFFPVKQLASKKEEFTFLEIFSELTRSRQPKDIFELDNIILFTIFNYLEKKDKLDIWKVFEIYFDINRTDIEYIIFDVKEINLENSNLEYLFKVILDSLKNIKVNISEQIKKEFGKLENLSKYERVDFTTDIISDEIEIFLNATKYDLKDIEYANLGYDEINFSKIDENKLYTLEGNKFLYGYDDNGIFKLILLPKILTRIYSVIKSRKSVYDKGDSSFLFKPVLSIDELKHNSDFNKTVKVLEQHHKYNIDDFPNINSLEEHLYKWLSLFKCKLEINALLYVLANHQYFYPSDISNFISKIEEFQKNSNVIVTTLKEAGDNNGTHRLLTLRNSDLWRNKGSEFKNFPKRLITDKSVEKVVFLSDNILSGTQTSKSFAEYYLRESHVNNSKDYFEVLKTNFDEFKNRIKTLDEIIFLSVKYTRESKQTIREDLLRLGFKGKISFEGIEVSFEKCKYECLDEIDKTRKFEELLQKTDFLKNTFEMDDFLFKDDKYNFSEFKPSNDINKQNLMARLNSMPKKRFFLFTLKPKNYKYSLFHYIEDKKYS